MKALITGGAGFIGLHLARTLGARGWSVTLVDQADPHVGIEEVNQFVRTGAHEFLTRDLRHANALDDLGTDFTCVFHLAARLGVAAVRRDPLAVLRDNIAMQLHALEFAARQSSLQRFLFTSTSEVYAGTAQHFSVMFPTPETTPLAIPSLAEPRTSYMLSKIYGEALMHQSGIPFVVVRPHNIYGPRMGTRHVIPELMQRIAALAPGARLEVYSPDHSRTFCYVQDAIDMTLALVEAPASSSGTFNIGSEQPEVTMRELGERIVRLMGRQITIADGPVTPGSPPRRQPDVSQVAAVTGIRPRVSLDEGLQMTFEWYDHHLLHTGTKLQ